MTKKPKKQDLKNARIISPEEAKEMRVLSDDENDALREKACEGKNISDICRWTSTSGVENIGLCKKTILGIWSKLLCTGEANSGSGSGSGETINNKILACEGKSINDPCSFITNSGTVSYGHCKIDNNGWTSGTLYCSNAALGLADGNSLKDAKTDDLL